MIFTLVETIISRAVARRDMCVFVTDVNFLNKYLAPRKCGRRQRGLVFFARLLI